MFEWRGRHHGSKYDELRPDLLRFEDASSLILLRLLLLRHLPKLADVSQLRVDWLPLWRIESQRLEEW